MQEPPIELSTVPSVRLHFLDLSVIYRLASGITLASSKPLHGQYLYRRKWRGRGRVRLGRWSREQGQSLMRRVQKVCTILDGEPRIFLLQFTPHIPRSKLKCDRYAQRLACGTTKGYDTCVCDPNLTLQIRRSIPCQSCVRRGCAAICPTGISYVLADRKHEDSLK